MLHIAAFHQRHPGQAAGGHIAVRRLQDERAQIDVARFRGVLAENRHRGKRDQRLAEIVARIVLDPAGEFLAFGRAGLGTHQHAVAARFVGGLYDELVEVGEHMLSFLVVETAVARHIGQDRILVEVVLDEVRHIGIDDLVVRHAGPRRVGERDIALDPRLEQAWYAEHRSGIEHGRVEKHVVDAPIDHIDLGQAADIAHVYAIVLDDEIAAFDEFGAHALGEIRMFEIGGIVDSRRQHHDFGKSLPARRQRGEHVEQLL